VSQLYQDSSSSLVISVPIWQYRSLPSCSSKRRSSSVNNCSSYSANLRKEVRSPFSFSSFFPSLEYYYSCMALPVFLHFLSYYQHLLIDFVFHLLQCSQWIRSEPSLSANVSSVFHTQIYGFFVCVQSVAFIFYSPYGFSCP
jgi:hypothetical protein